MKMTRLISLFALAGLMSTSALAADWTDNEVSLLHGT